VENNTWKEAEYIQIMMGRVAPFLQEGFEIVSDPQKPFKPYFITHDERHPRDYPVWLRRIVC